MGPAIEQITSDWYTPWEDGQSATTTPTQGATEDKPSEDKPTEESPTEETKAPQVINTEPEQEETDVEETVPMTEPSIPETTETAISETLQTEPGETVQEEAVPTTEQDQSPKSGESVLWIVLGALLLASGVLVVLIAKLATSKSGKYSGKKSNHRKK